jgi:hypothetical protein
MAGETEEKHENISGSIISVQTEIRTEYSSTEVYSTAVSPTCSVTPCSMIQTFLRIMVPPSSGQQNSDFNWQLYNLGAGGGGL